jgi:hypothetical protein
MAGFSMIRILVFTGWSYTQGAAAIHLEDQLHGGKKV